MKLQKFNKHLNEKNYNAGDIIYKQGDDAQVFYIMKRGSVLMETIIEIDDYNRYPIGIKTWEVVKTTQLIKYKVEELHERDIFGHQEILLAVPR